MDKNKILRNRNNVLIIDGVPYSLVRFNGPVNFVVCAKCDLKKICFDADDNTKLVDLCICADKHSGWFFQRDLKILDNKISEYVDPAILAEEDDL